MAFHTCSAELKKSASVRVILICTWALAPPPDPMALTRLPSHSQLVSPHLWHCMTTNQGRLRILPLRRARGCRSLITRKSRHTCLLQHALRLMWWSTFWHIIEGTWNYSSSNNIYSSPETVHYLLWLIPRSSPWWYVMETRNECHVCQPSDRFHLRLWVISLVPKAETYESVWK